MSILILILKLFPLLLATIQQIEALAPVPKAGPSKLKLVTDTISSALQVDSTDLGAVPQNKLLSTVEAVTSNVVSFCNQLGIFKKSA